MNKDLFLKMVDCTIKGQKLELKEIDKDFLYTAKEQTFLSFIWYVSNNEEYKNYYIRTNLILERVEEAANYLDKILNDNNIPHIFLKGYFLKDLYPDPVLRMCGDVDILVKKEDYNRVINLLRNNENISLDKEDVQHFKLRYKGILIELHKEIFDHNIKTTKIFDDFFVKSIKVKDYLYKLEDNFNFVYIITHYAKHINMGAGLRPLCDIYLMLTKLELDIEYINKELEKMGLSKFFNMVLNELNVLFGYDTLPFTKNDKVNEMIDFCLKSGVHGQGRKSNRVENSVNTVGNGNKFVYIIKRLFISPAEMFHIYPWTKSIILLPFGYIFRFFKLLFTKRKKLNKVLKYKKSDKYYLMESIGLVNEKGKIF